MEDEARTSTADKLKVSVGGRVRLGVDERRARLLELGKELFILYSYDELSIDMIARYARISKGLLYHYFPTKRDFYVAVIQAGVSELLTKTETPAGLNSLERLVSGLDAYLEHVALDEKLVAAVMCSGIGLEPEVARAVNDARRELLKRMLDEVPDRTPRMRNALSGWLGFVEGAVADWLEHKQVSKSELRELLVMVARETIGSARKALAGRSPEGGSE